MRANEFIVEYRLSVSKDADGVAVRATAGGKNLGHAEFFFDEEGRLDPQTVWVDERYHGQGIARDMYDHLKDLGYTIVRSWDQTDAGKGFWNKHRGEDARVWEQELSEISRDRLERYLSRAALQVDSRQERMARARQRLNTSYEIYRAEEPTKIVDRFEADTPADAQRYYQDYIERYESDVDYDLRLRRGTGIMEAENNSTPEVYLDMDGVLADFMAGYNRVAGTNYEPGQQLPHPSQDPTLKKITGTDFFSTLPKFASANALVKMIVDQYGHYNICSSPLRGDHENSASNKRAWLIANLQPQPQEIVITSRKEKYAVQPDGTPNILVDDKPENVQRWRDAGGIGILYNAAVDGLDTVATGLQLNENFADGKKPGRKGLSRRVGIPKKATLAQLQKIASSSTGERRRMAQWQLNMRRGKAKKAK